MINNNTTTGITKIRSNIPRSPANQPVEVTISYTAYAITPIPIKPSVHAKILYFEASGLICFIMAMAKEHTHRIDVVTALITIITSKSDGVITRPTYQQAKAMTNKTIVLLHNFDMVFPPELSTKQYVSAFI